MTNIDFARNLVKGKIAETIFAQMLRETNGLVETLRSSPDFAVINKEKREVRLIEVKYQRKINSEYVLKAATRMHASWNPSYLFIATQDGFYFDEINKIIENEGKIAELKHPFISQELQDKYLKILIDFESDN